MYVILPAAYGNGFFTVPSSLADKHLIMAGGAQLKVILFMLRNSFRPLDIDEIAAAVGLAPEEAADAVLYWTREGLVAKADDIGLTPLPTDSPQTPSLGVTAESGTNGTNGMTAESGMTAAKDAPQKSIKPTLSVKPSGLTLEEISKRIIEDPEITVLLSEAQGKLGRTLGRGDQSALILLHDYYGLPVEIILIICEYARSHNKSGNTGYIFTMGADWSKREIDTIEAADEELKAIETTVEHWAAYCAAAGIKSCRPTTQQRGFFESWINTMKFSVDVIAAAYAEMQSNTKKISYSYMNGILAAWHKDGVKTIEDVEERAKKHAHEAQNAALGRKTKKQSEKAAVSGGKTASYDISKAEQKARSTVPTLKKKEKR